MSTAADIEARMLLHVQYALARICLDECVDISVLFDQVSDHLVTSMQAKIPTELALLGRVKELQAALDAATAERDAARARVRELEAALCTFTDMWEWRFNGYSEPGYVMREYDSGKMFDALSRARQLLPATDTPTAPSRADDDPLDPPPVEG